MKAQLCTAYLYADGHAVLIYRKTDPQAGEITWCEIIDSPLRNKPLPLSPCPVLPA